MIDLSVYNYINPPVISNSVVNDCINFLIDNNKGHTLEHSLAVSKTCIELAHRFNLDKDIAETAAMLHDVSSVMNPSDMMEYAINQQWHIDEAEQKYPFILHQRISCSFAKDVFGINDTIVLSMIECHSTLHKKPSDYDILLFLSDKLSWDQDGIPPFFDVVSDALEHSLNYAALVYINFVMDNGFILFPHKWLLEAKNFLQSSMRVINDNLYGGIGVNKKRELTEIKKEEMTGTTVSSKCSTSLDAGPFYHGTKADLKPGDLLEPGHSSNYGEQKKANYVYLTATLDAAVWGAELAMGDEPGRIYRVEPMGTFEDDPNLTDKKFPGNPTRSYRTQQPLRVVGEVLDWEGHSPEVLRKMRDHLEELKRLGIEAIND